MQNGMRKKMNAGAGANVIETFFARLASAGRHATRQVIHSTSASGLL